MLKDYYKLKKDEQNQPTGTIEPIILSDSEHDEQIKTEYIFKSWTQATIYIDKTLI